MKIIGITTTYNGKDWRWMRGLTVRIIAVCKRLDPADEEYELCTDDRMIQRLGRDQEQDGLHPRGDEPLSGVDGGGRCGAASDAAMSPEEMRRARLSQQIISQLAESTGR